DRRVECRPGTECGTGQARGQIGPRAAQVEPLQHGKATVLGGRPAPVSVSPRNDAPELSSLATVLDDLSRRVTAMAERRARAEPDEVANALFEVERSLRETRRRLQNAVDLLS